MSLHRGKRNGKPLQYNINIMTNKWTTEREKRATPCTCCCGNGNACFSFCKRRLIRQQHFLYKVKRKHTALRHRCLRYWTKLCTDMDMWNITFCGQWLLRDKGKSIMYPTGRSPLTGEIKTQLNTTPKVVKHGSILPSLITKVHSPQQIEQCNLEGEKETAPNLERAGQEKKKKGNISSSG